MAITLSKLDLPGKKIKDKLLAKWNSLGTRGKIIVGAIGVIAVVSVGAVAYFGAAALITAGMGLLTAGIFTKLGVIALLAVLWTVGINTIQVIWNFDWNVTDEALRKQIKDQIKTFYGLTGQLLGSSIGYVTCGGLPGMLLFTFNPTVAALVLRDLSEEAGEEIISQLAAIANNTIRLGIQILLSKAFIKARRYAKRPGTPVYNLLKRFMSEDDIKQWGAKDSKTFSFSRETEERIEKIKDNDIKSFVENFYDGFGDSCSDAAYVLGNSLFENLARLELQNQQQFGNKEVISVEFD